MRTENERLRLKNHTFNEILKDIKEEARWYDNDKKELIDAVEKITYFNKKRSGIMD